MAIIFKVGCPRALHLAEVDEEGNWFWEKFEGLAINDDLERLEVRELIERLMELSNLKPMERLVVKGFLAGETFQDLARHLRKSRQTIAQDFYRAVAKMRQVAKTLGINP